MTRPPNRIKVTAKFLTYVLGRRPDEFGLVPDAHGFVEIKELIKAMHEEQGWRHLRLGHLNELKLVLTPSPIEIKGKLIRAKDRSRLPVITHPKDLPKTLYTSIRKRAYRTVLERGLAAGHRPHLLLTPDLSMAKRVGQRLDNDPVVLTVQVPLSQTKGTHYQQYGNHLYLADIIPSGTFRGPALPKASAELNRPKQPKEQTQPKTPGSYYPEVKMPEKANQPLPRTRQRKETEWKKARRQARKHKKQRGY